MDTTDPNIEFDEKGVCNHCHTYGETVRQTVLSGAQGEQRLRSLVAEIKRAGAGKTYDSVIGLSGGVDSSYVAYQVVKLGLRPLAVHLDNGWDSELAVKNIENICRKLGIDLHTIVLDWEEFRDLQVAFLRACTPDAEIPSDHAIVSAMRLTAAKIGVRYIINGCNTRTEMHLPMAWSQGHSDWRYIKSIHKQFGTIPLKTFPHLNYWTSLRLKLTQHFINILDYLDYVKKDAMRILEQELDWRYYGGKHYESTYTRWYQGFWLPHKFGYDKRRSHMSSLICSCELSRAEALEALKAPTYEASLQEEDTNYVIKKLCLSDEEFARILNSPNKSFWDYPSYARMAVLNKPYEALRSVYRIARRSKGS